MVNIESKESRSLFIVFSLFISWFGVNFSRELIEVFGWYGKYYWIYPMMFFVSFISSSLYLKFPLARWVSIPIYSAFISFSFCRFLIAAVRPEWSHIEWYIISIYILILMYVVRFMCPTKEAFYYWLLGGMTASLALILQYFIPFRI